MKFQKWLYIMFFALSALLTVFTVVVSLNGTSGTEDSVFKSVWVVFIFAFYVLVQLFCFFTAKSKKLTIKRLGFYLLHIGLILFLLGSFIYYISGDVVSVSVPVNDSAVYNKIKRDKLDEHGNDILKLDFGIGISKFSVERYADDNDEEKMDKWYEATLLIVPNGTREIKEKILTVNNPVRQSGWKIYLMNYDKATESSVQLMMKYDPGEYVSLMGIWFTIVGAFLMCFKKRNGACNE